MSRLSQLFTDPMGFIMSLLLVLPGVLIGLSFHEFAHALAATKMGDDTPRLMGRLTLDPFAHFDPIGLGMLLLLGFGYGKPVVVNPARFKNRFWGELLVAISGVLMNFILAFLFTFLYLALVFKFNVTNYYVTTIVLNIISINIVLMVFNLLPLPPLDGYRVVKRLFIGNVNPQFFWKLEQYGFFIVLILLATDLLTPFLSWAVNGVYGFMIDVSGGLLGIF
ncbi:site-2 protease family protein [Christensenella sp. MSJ-20]|uniref:site-2 protease family protein n=1 Tax=Christensenella sp. MSJ-20 TaxID=2841518 RepID=UPI000D78F34E|nr:MAG: site-2 protease family protein [Bacillota bacterium]QWT55698.1 site-2 protease family protein [Christensenella sp. MSJ-20]